MGKTVEKKDELLALANKQIGYFTAKQAQAVGYNSAQHTYHVQTGNWLRIGPGLYRLPGFAESYEANCLAQVLLSRNHADEPQAVISHYSALHLHGLAANPPAQIYLTVPPAYRKALPPEVVVHKHRLTAAEIEWRGAYRLTSEGRTLVDCQALKTAEAQRLRAVEAKSATEISPLPALAGAGRERSLSMSPELDRTPALPRRREAGFTLVELLVVMAIISVLAGMLLPALERGLSLARATACQNSLKQVMMGVGLYAGDYGDFLVPCFSPSDSVPGSLNHWTGSLRGYFAINRTAAFTKATDLSVAVCPESPQRFGYSYNYTELGFNQESTNYFLFRKYAGASNPGATLAFADSILQTAPDPRPFGSWHSYLRPPWFYPGLWDMIVNFGHQGRANVIWLDGHVTARLESDGLLYAPDSQKEWWAYKK